MCITLKTLHVLTLKTLHVLITMPSCAYNNGQPYLATEMFLDPVAYLYT